MSKVIMRAGKVIVSVLLPFIVVCFIIYTALANNPASEESVAQTPQDSVEATVDKSELQTDAINREEVVDLRDDNTRVWETTKLVDKYNPKTRQYEKVEQTSRIVEKGCGICYLDESDQWQVTDTGWIETDTGFVMNKAPYSLEIGKAVGNYLKYTVNEKPLELRPVSLYLDDSQSGQLVAQINANTQGYIDTERPNVLVFTDALGTGIDVEYEALPGGYHQNVVFREKPVLTKNMDLSGTKYRLYTEVRLDSSLTSPDDDTSDVRLSFADDESKTNNQYSLSSFSETASTVGSIDFIARDSEGNDFVTHRFAESKIFEFRSGSAKKDIGKAEKHFVKTDDKTYLVESVDAEVIANADGNVVWDYQTVSVPLTEDEIWYADATYYISAAITIDSGVTLKIEPGTVVKFDEMTAIMCGGSLLAEGQPYLPIIFTSKNDNSVGEVITGSTGYPDTNDWEGIWNQGGGWPPSQAEGFNISFCNIYYAATGLASNGGSTAGFIDIHDDQFYFCGSGVQCSGTEVNITNNLFKGCGWAIDIGGNSDYEVNIVNNTFDMCSAQSMTIQIWDESSPTDEVSINVINNIFANSQTGIGGAAMYRTSQQFSNIFTESNNAFYNILGTYKIAISCDWGNETYTQTSPTDVIPTVNPFDTTNTILGTYYLNDNANGGDLLIDAGSDNVEEYYSAPNDWSVYHVPMDGIHGSIQTVSLTTNATWQPNYATCDYGIVDIGYHYPRYDYVFGSVNSSSGAELEIMPDTVIHFANNPVCWFSGHVFSNGLPGKEVVLLGPASISLSGYSITSELTWAHIYNIHVCDELGSLGSFNNNTLIFSEYWDDGCPTGIINNLWLYSHLRAFAVVRNNTFYGSCSGITFIGDGPHDVRNCLFLRNDRSIWLWDGEQYYCDLTELNNFFCDNSVDIYVEPIGYPPHILPVGGYSRNNLTVSDVLEDPYACIGKPFYLASDSLAIDEGDGVGMLGYTTQSNLTEDVTPADIGYHYPILIDSDDDDLINYDERVIYGTDPYFADTDYDGLDDDEEIFVYLTDPTLADSDDDTMPDKWEIDYGLDPIDPEDADDDSDGDGLTNVEEFIYGFNPNVVDISDGAVAYAYDFAGNVIREVRISEAISGLDIRIQAYEYGYDAYGRNVLERQICNYVKGENNSIGADDSVDKITVHQYDYNDRIVKSFQKGYASDGTANTNVSYAQNGDIVEEKEYDDFGRLSKTYKYEYDSYSSYNGRNNGQYTEYSYVNGRLTDTKMLVEIGTTSNAYQITARSYDAAGRVDTVSQIVDSDTPVTIGWTTTTYNSLGQSLAQVVYDNSGTSPVAVKQTRAAYNGIGNITMKAIMANPAMPLILGVDKEVDSVVEYIYKPYDISQVDTAAGKLVCQKKYYGCTNPALTGGYDGQMSTIIYEYDYLGRRIAVKDFGNTFTLSSGVPDYSSYSPFVETILSYDPMNRVSSQRKMHRIGVPNYYTVENDITTVYGYDVSGNVTSVSSRPNPLDSLTWETRYYTYQLNRKTSETSPLGIVTVYVYDAFGNMTEKVEDSGSSRLNKTTNFEYDRLGRHTAVVAVGDSINQTTGYTYDYQGNVTSIHYPDQTTANYQYNLLGKPVTFTRKVDDDEESEITLYYAYDYNGRCVFESDDEIPLGDTGSTASYICTYSYDMLGNRTSATKQDTDGLFTESIFTYNDFGVVVSEQTTINGASQLTTLYSYDQAGNLVSKQHNNGQVVTYQYDGHGQISNVEAGTSQISNYCYAGNYLMEQYHGSLDLITAYFYDEHGRLSRKITEEVNSPYQQMFDYEYDYDKDGRRLSTKYSQAAEDNYDYDRLNRLTHVWPVSNGEPQLYEYDINGNRIAATFKDGHTEGYEVDPANNQYRNTGPIGIWKMNETSGTTAYDSLGLNDGQIGGSPTRVTGHYGNALDFASGDYVNPGNSTSIKPQLPVSISAWVKPEDLTRSNNPIIKIDNQKYGIYGITMLVNTKKLYTQYGDGTNYRSKIGTTELEEDQWYHVVAVLRGPGDMSLYINGVDDGGTYAGTGGAIAYSSANIGIGGHDDSANYFDGVVDDVRVYNHALTEDEISVLYASTSDDIITYDDYGNMTFDGRHNYSYNLNGRLANIDNGNIVYKYDALGRLAISTTGGVGTYYYYDTAGRVIAEYSTEDDGVTLDIERTYIWGGGFNEILTMTEGTNTKYMLTDALGSVTCVYNASTATVEFTTYDVYGNSETAPASPYGYAGMRYVAAFDGYITPNRAYSPKLGRWLQSDPLGTTPNPQTGNVYSPLKQYSDGLNLYAYVGNEPVNGRDEWGLEILKYRYEESPGELTTFGYEFEFEYEKSCGEDGLSPAYTPKGIKSKNILAQLDDLSLGIWGTSSWIEVEQNIKTAKCSKGGRGAKLEIGIVFTPMGSFGITLGIGPISLPTYGPSFPLYPPYETTIIVDCCCKGWFYESTKKL